MKQTLSLPPIYGIQPLKSILRDRGLNQEDVARTIGHRESYLNNILNGKREIPLRHAVKLSDLVGLPLDESDTSERQT